MLLLIPVYMLHSTDMLYLLYSLNSCTVLLNVLTVFEDSSVLLHWLYIESELTVKVYTYYYAVGFQNRL